MVLVAMKLMGGGGHIRRTRLGWLMVCGMVPMRLIIRTMTGGKGEGIVEVGAGRQADLRQIHMSTLPKWLATHRLSAM